MMSVTTMGVADVTIGDRFRRDLGDISSLARSIEEVGLLQPIVVDQTGRLVAGHRRLEACKSLGRSTVPVHIVNLLDIMKGEFHENAVRKGFTASEIVAIKRALEPTVQKEAKRRQGKRTDLGRELPADSARSRDVISEYAGVSHDTLARMERLVKAAEKDPATFGPILQRVDEDQISLNKAISIIRNASIASPEQARQEGNRQPNYPATTEKSGDARTPMKKTARAALKSRRHLKVMTELKEKPELGPSRTGMSQAVLDSTPAFQKCPYCGSDSTQIVWKCCLALFKQEEPAGERDRQTKRPSSKHITAKLAIEPFEAKQA